MQKGCRRCVGEKELEVGGGRHVLDRRLGNRLVIVKCAGCGSVHYRVPLAQWAEVEQDAALEQAEGGSEPTGLPS